MSITRIAIISVSIIVSASAAVTDVRVTDPTATEAVLRYTAPDNLRCKIEVSYSPTFTPVVPDVDSTLFAGSNYDDTRPNLNRGRERVLAIGQAGSAIRYAPVAASGKRVSRALQVATRYYGRLSCGPGEADQATFEFKTADYPSGSTYSDFPFPIDPNNLGTLAVPTVDFNAPNSAYIDPET